MVQSETEKSLRPSRAQRHAALGRRGHDNLYMLEMAPTQFILLFDISS